MPRRAAQFWLLKSEPDVFSYADLVQAGREPWNGIRNYQARNFLAQMRRGDLGLFYHSNAKPAGIAGVLRVTQEAVSDDLQFDPASPYYDPKADRAAPRWSMVEVEPLAAFPALLSLDRVRQLPDWASSPLTQRGTRLSVLPVTPEQFRAALEAAHLDLDQIDANG